MSLGIFVGVPQSCFTAAEIPIATSTLLFLGYDTSLTRNTELWRPHQQQRRHRVKELSYIILKPLFKNWSDHVCCAFFTWKKKKSVRGPQLPAQVERVGKARKKRESGGIAKMRLSLVQRGEGYWPSGRYGVSW